MNGCIGDSLWCDKQILKISTHIFSVEMLAAAGGGGVAEDYSYQGDKTRTIYLKITCWSFFVVLPLVLTDVNHFLVIKKKDRFVKKSLENGSYIPKLKPPHWPCG